MDTCTTCFSISSLSLLNASSSYSYSLSQFTEQEICSYSNKPFKLSISRPQLAHFASIVHIMLANARPVCVFKFHLVIARPVVQVDVVDADAACMAVSSLYVSDQSSYFSPSRLICCGRSSPVGCLYICMLMIDRSTASVSAG